MDSQQVVTLMRCGDSLSLAIPAQMARDLGFRRGDLFKIATMNLHCIIYERIKIVPDDSSHEPRVRELPKIKYD